MIAGKKLSALMDATYERLEAIDGVGPIVAQSVRDWFDDPENKKLVERLLKQLSLEKMQKAGGKLEGKIFVLTGTLQSLGRDEAKDKIRALGGSVSSSVSKNTDYVVAGEAAGSKLDRARELGVKIMTEEEFLELIRKK